MTFRLVSGAITALAIVLSSPASPHAQTDLDAFMQRVLARRDENWKKLQQYVLDERETFQLTGPGGTRLYGFTRDYTWFIKQGYFIQSPVRVDGVRISDEERLREEQKFIEREKAREKRAAERAAERAREGGEPVDPAPAPDPTDTPASVEDVLRTTTEPRFVSAAYFMRFRFDPGHYALAGREKLGDTDVLRIEYYPSLLFKEGRSRPNREIRAREQDVEKKMNKVSLVTLWIDPKTHQILQYTFDNIDMDFLPGRSLVRLDELKASMRMIQPFPDVWLPATIDMRFRMTLAIGSVAAQYDVEYHDYRQAEVTARIKP